MEKQKSGNCQSHLQPSDSLLNPNLMMGSATSSMSLGAKGDHTGKEASLVSAVKEVAFEEGKEGWRHRDGTKVALDSADPIRGLASEGESECFLGFGRFCFAIGFGPALAFCR
ncbi:hypothetical protein NL676_022751 [Syzygium grande]|nr:hypothetical protein NL676_022751 [Syzygium grande]